MAKHTVLFFLSAFLTISGAFGLDLPFDLSFQLGFNVQVVPSPDDASRTLGLVVTTDKIYTDKAHSLVITGTIANYGSDPCVGIDMHFAVTSYVGTGVSRNRGNLSSTSLQPGEIATFTTHISLDSERPRLAMYTITGHTPVMYVQEPVPMFVSPSEVPVIDMR